LDRAPPSISRSVVFVYCPSFKRISNDVFAVEDELIVSPWAKEEVAKAQELGFVPEYLDDVISYMNDQKGELLTEKGVYHVTVDVETFKCIVEKESL